MKEQIIKHATLIIKSIIVLIFGWSIWLWTYKSQINKAEAFEIVEKEIRADLIESINPRSYYFWNDEKGTIKCDLEEPIK